ncbi:FAD-dependent monooxygenase [Nocardia panacis]|uniref:FAD-dependent monooxygenase n=1 Tax=Nocardia panacis TaxID=2340916 RepID=A0A3A4KK83_9NOCA|nr:NAD(P)/FAD-dependent oxidoreductase [Nocardia panacis]RJO75362.1 FAD-dependent monooxygenase [Nocardia panacis]
MSTFTVAIAGAGLGGLALAQGLRERGINATVYERDTALDSRRQGYRLHLDASARDALHRLLPPRLTELFHATAGTPKSRFTLLDRNLNELLVRDSAEPALAVDRLTLRAILLTGIEDMVVFGKSVSGYEFEGCGRIAVHLADGDIAPADVLVGADGINSVVRRQYLPHARVVDTGVWQLYGAIPLTDRTRELFDHTMFGVFTMITGLDGSFVGVAPVEFPDHPAAAAARLLPGPAALPPASDYMTCSFGARGEWFGPTRDLLRDFDGERLHEIVTDAVRTWHPRVRGMVAACDPQSMFALPLRSSVPVPAWPTTPVTLLGDAIHAMSPASGSGACTALRDAANLADALTAAAGGRELRTALHDYERDMIDYGFSAVRTGADSGQRFLGQDPLPAH